MIPMRFKKDKVVTNTSLDVLQAGCRPFSSNRLVYVCLREAQSHYIEFSKQEQMLGRI